MMKKFLNSVAVLFGFEKKSKYVKNYLHDQNTRSGIFMGAIIFMLEVWLIIRQTTQFFETSAPEAATFENLIAYDSIYILFLLVGLAMTFLCITEVTVTTLKPKTKLILNLVFSGLLCLFCFYIFKPSNFKAWNGTLRNNVLNVFLILLYILSFSIGVVSIVYSLLRYFNKVKSGRNFFIAVIILFAALCLAFGVRVSFSDHYRTSKSPNEIICFLTMVIYVSCLLIWRPWISIVLNLAIFLGFYGLLKQSDAEILAGNLVTIITGGKEYIHEFTEGDSINYITFFVSLTMVSVMVYHQRRTAALKDEELLYQADYDVLTDLHNNEYFIRQVDSFAAAYPNLLPNRIVLFINIENFKSYNDQRGFQSGNVLLANAGHIMEELFEKNWTCRQSDDHYIVFASTNGFEEKLNILNQRIIDLDKEVGLTIKVGGYIPKEKEDTRRIIDKARYACSVISSRKDSIFLEYDQKMHNEYHLMQYVIHNVDKAVENDWIQPFYQPVTFSKSEHLCGFEALARWNDPRYGFLSPALFIPTLENTKLIHKVDAHIIKCVCRDIRKTLDAGLPALPVSINFSRLDFELMDAVGHLEEMMKVYDIPKEMIHVEITESALTENVELLHENVMRLKKAGYALWLDDFGSGYSSLNVLKDFPFDVMKIDMVFLKNFSQNEKAKPLIESVIAMANKMGMRTLAEGVETEDQKEFLKKVKCERLQGFYYGQAKSYEDTIARMKGNDFVISDSPQGE